MNSPSTEQTEADPLAADQAEAEKLASLKKLAFIVYFCQVLTFMLAGVPLLAGVLINFLNRNKAQGTWLQSHFDWQIQTAWVALAGFALSGLLFAMGIGVFILIATVIWMIYRIAIGWYALSDGKPVDNTIN